MGQLSLFSVVAIFLISGVIVYNANSSADRAGDRVWEHQYNVVARDAAATGLASAMRTLSNGFEANTAWNGGLASSLAQTDVAYDGGTYTVTATAVAPSPAACPLLNATEYAKAIAGHVPQGDVITITSTGTYLGDVGGNSNQRHQLRACYLKADYGLFAPPAFNYGFISDDEFTFNGGPTIQALVAGEGHVHANGDMTLGPQVEIDGHATYTGTGSIHANTQVASSGNGPTVPLVPFDAGEFATDNNIPAACTANPDRCRYQNGFTSSGNQVIAPPSCASAHCIDQPYIWYIDGDFTLSGSDHIRVPQYTTIVVTGNINISGTSAVTVTGETLRAYCERLRGGHCNQNQMDARARDWVLSQLFDGVHSPLAWYAGTHDSATNTTSGGNVNINGTSALVGNFYVNGNVNLNGGGTGNNTLGSFASANGDITANGGGNGNNFWFLEVAEENVIEGVQLPGKQIVRLAFAEWTDPVLDN